MPLTPSGFTSQRASDFFATIQAALDASGVSYDLGYDQPLGIIAATVAEVMGEQSEIQRAIYDSRVLANAVGVQLDDLGDLAGIPREAAVASSVTIRFAGTAGTVIPAGTVVQGGGTDGLATWATSDAATVGGGGTVDVVAACTVTGPTAAPGSSITTVVTPTSPATTVTNPAAAALGSDIESDASYRRRIRTSMRGTGDNRSERGIRAALEDIDGITAASCTENATAAVVSGIDPYTVRAVVYPSSLTADQLDALALVLYDRVALGIGTTGTQSATVTDTTTGVARVVRWDFASSVGVAIVVTVVLEAGVALADVQDAIEEAVAAYIATLSVGDDVYRLGLYNAVADVDGVVDVTGLTIDGISASKAIGADEIATLASVSVTT